MKLAIFILCITLISCKGKSNVVFEDNFDGTSLNENIWNYELGDGCPALCGWGNNEKQSYEKSNVRVENGHLIITANKNADVYTSGKINTKDNIEFQYGNVVVRAKLATGKGLWPAVWMLGNDIDEVQWPACGEIDMLEYVGKEPNVIFTSLHTPDSHGNTVNTKKTTVLGIEDGFHIYSTNWTKDAITFSIDGNEVYQFNPTTKNKETWPFDKPFYMLINLAIGGNFGGPEVDDTIFPKEFIIDYIKVNTI